MNPPEGNDPKVVDHDARPKRRAVVPPDDPAFAAEERGAVASGFLGALRQAYSEPIRIDENGESRMGLYVTKRYEVMKPNDHRIKTGQPPVELLFEEKLHKNFWQPSDINIPLLFLLGVVGSGKTTLLHYYLHHHCKKQRNRLDDYRRKLIVSVNLRNVRTADELVQRVYRLIRLRLMEKCEERGFDLMTADDFGMWRGMLNFSSAVYGSFTIEDKRKAVVEKMRTITDEEFVKQAFTYLSEKIDSKNGDACPFGFLVLVLDNMDHSPYPVIERAMQLVHEWFELKLKIWKVYVPLWPVTYYQFRHQYSRFPVPAEVIEIGRLDEDEVFKKRSEMVRELVEKEDRDVTLKGEDGTDLVIKPNEASRYASWGRFDAPDKFCATVKALSGHSVHRSLLMWENTLSSVVLERHYLRERKRRTITSEGHLANVKSSSFEHITNYGWNDALFTGKNRYHHRLASPIPNLFYCVGKVEAPEHVLVGPHILYVINRKFARRRDLILGHLLPFGHDKESIEEALEYFRIKHLFEWFWLDRRTDFDLYPGMGPAYCNLLTNPAYVDNMALTTPVAPERLALMKLTRSDEPGHFVPRVRTTLQFLEQIRDDEDAFRTWVPGRGNCSFEEFKRKFDDFEFPCVFERMALAYKWRLEFLRDEERYLTEIERAQWNDLINATVLQNIPSRPKSGDQSYPKWQYLEARMLNDQT